MSSQKDRNIKKRKKRKTKGSGKEKEKKEQKNKKKTPNFHSAMTIRIYRSTRTSIAHKPDF